MNYKQKLGKQATAELLSLVTEGFDVKLHKTENMAYAFLQRLRTIIKPAQYNKCIRALFLMVMHRSKMQDDVVYTQVSDSWHVDYIYTYATGQFDFKTSDDLTKKQVNERIDGHGYLEYDVYGKILRYLGGKKTDVTGRFNARSYSFNDQDEDLYISNANPMTNGQLACNALGGTVAFSGNSPTGTPGGHLVAWAPDGKGGVLIADSNYPRDLVDLQATFQRYYVPSTARGYIGTGNNYFESVWHNGNNMTQHDRMAGRMSDNTATHSDAMFAGLYLGPKTSSGGMIGSIRPRTLPVPTMNASRIQSTPYAQRSGVMGRVPGTLNDTSSSYNYGEDEEGDVYGATDMTRFEDDDDFDSDDEMESEDEIESDNDIESKEMFILALAALLQDGSEEAEYQMGGVSKIPNLMFSAGLVALTAVIGLLPR
jgi:hypothetical protein